MQVSAALSLHCDGDDGLGTGTRECTCSPPTTLGRRQTTAASCAGLRGHAARAEGQGYRVAAEFAELTCRVAARNSVTGCLIRDATGHLVDKVLDSIDKFRTCGSAPSLVQATSGDVKASSCLRSHG